MSHHNILLCIAVFSAMVLFLVPGAAAFSTRIGAATEECFSQRAEHASKVSFSFVVTHGGDLDVDVHLFSRYLMANKEHTTLSTDYRLQTTTLRQWKLATSGSHQHGVPSNAVGLAHELVACISNNHSHFLPKWVSFSFNVMDIPGATVNEHGYTPEEVDRESRVHQAAQTIYTLMQDTEKVKAAEMAHRDMVESTNAWIGYGTVVNCLLLIALSLFQFAYLVKLLKRPVFSL